MDLNDFIKCELFNFGADLVGFGNLALIPGEVRFYMPVGISVAVKYPKEVIRSISEMPTVEYYEYYNKLNQKLDNIVRYGERLLKEHGYEAVAQTLEFVSRYETDYSSVLPHKTVATRAGIGWIGKSALLVTREFGSAIRISSILTNAPLKTTEPVNNSSCMDCIICTLACPGKAILGKNWSVETPRNEIFSAELCRKTARERAKESLGFEKTICGKCIYVCPYTQRYINNL